MRLIDGGNFGINTSTPSQTLHVHGNALVENDVGNVLTIRSTVNNGNDPNIYFEKGRGGAGTTAIVQDNDDLGDIQWRGYDGNSYDVGARIVGKVEGTPADGNIPSQLLFQTRADGGSLNTRMNISSSGKIGIGTGVSPQVPLDIGGVSSGGLTGLSNSVFYAGFANNTNFGGVVLGAGINGNTPFIAAAQKSDQTALPLDISTDGTSRVRIQGNGRIGIGTTAPVAGIEQRTNENTGVVLRITSTQTTNTNKALRIRNNSNTDTVNISWMGLIACQTLTESSDIALKENIQPLSNTLEKIKRITGYKYNFKKSETDSVGVIAQDVEKVFPELVHGEEGTKKLQYSGLIGALIEAVKELSDKVTKLEAA